MAKDIISKLAGIIILLSIFLPVRYFSWVQESYFGGSSLFEEYHWMFGFTYISETYTKADGGSSVYTQSWFSLSFIPGIIIAMVILILAVLIILNASSGNGKGVITKGIISIILVVVEFSWYYYEFILWGRVGTYFFPYIGFFGIILGGILAIIGGNKLK